MAERSIDIVASGAEDQEDIPLEQALTLTGIASAEAFGTPIVAGPVTLVGVPSAEAFGNVFVGVVIYPNSIASAEAFGSPSVGFNIYPNGIPSAEAFGNVTVTQPIQLVGIPSAEAFGTPQVNLTIYPAAIPSAEVVNAVSISLVIYPASVPSAEAFGSPQLNLQVLVDGIPSEEAVSDVAVGFVINVNGIASAEAFGSPTLIVGFLVMPTSIPSAEAFGVPVVAGPIIVDGIPSAEAFGVVKIKNFGLLQVLSGGRGDIVGGTPILLAGAVLDMEPCADDFSDGVVSSALWNVLDSGGGQTTELGAAQALQLDTRGVAGAVAGLESVDTVTGVDVEVAFTPRIVSLPAGGTVRVASLRLVVSPGNEFRLDALATRVSSTLRVQEYVGGALFVDQEIALPGALRGPTVLRLVRTGQGRVVALMNGAKLADAVWVPDVAQFTFTVANDASVDSRVQTLVTSFVRRAAVQLGLEPVLAYNLLGSGRTIAGAPAADRPKVVTVSAYGCAFVDSVVNGFTYELSDRLAVATTAEHRLVVMNDLRLKEKK